MRGKEKCRALKEIRKQIAEKNDIEYAVSECSFQGECKGTCPKCEAELRYLERELERRKNLGKAVCVVGISASVCGSLTACNPAESIRDFVSDIFGRGVTEEIAGDVQIAPEPLTGDMPMVPEETAEPEDIDGGIMPPEEIETPAPDVLEGDVEYAPQETEVPVPEELEGDVVILPAPEETEVLAGAIPLAPEETETPASEEVEMTASEETEMPVPEE